jgi:hypothetical protein
MRNFRIERLPESEARVDRLIQAMDRYDLMPDYQRQSGIWSEEKRQLFVDSLINGYDVPKLYFHRLGRSEMNSPIFAIIDGKQRLETIRSFFREEFSLSDDFTDAEAELNEDAAAGKNYRELTLEHPVLAARFAHSSLDIVVVDTSDLEVVEEMFSRLNEAVPLNAPEKRNALRGAMPPIIRRLVSHHKFFLDRLPIENMRYRQFDLVTKFLFLSEKGEFAATKKRALDDFVKRFRNPKGLPIHVKQAQLIGTETSHVLDYMATVFVSQDELLSSVGLVTVYYMTFLKALKDMKLSSKLTRERLVEFDQLRRHNRLVQRQKQASIVKGGKLSGSQTRQDLAIFDRLMQSPNDEQALEYRFLILRAFLEEKKFSATLPKDLQSRIGGPD